MPLLIRDRSTGLPSQAPPRWAQSVEATLERAFVQARASGSAWLDRYGAVMLMAVVAQVVTYSYLLTTPILTNHTFPNTWINPYPSNKTLGEGRWFADVLIQLQGGSGVQPVQMVVAVTLQALNGILFARFLGLQRRRDLLLATLFLSLFPAFLDYYSFVVDHFAFVLADTLVIAGALLWQRRRHTVRAGLCTAGLWVLALAAYQPKIALIALLCLLYLANGIGGAFAGHPTARTTIRGIGREIVSLGAVFLGACLVYFLSARLTISQDIGLRTHVNSLPEVLSAGSAAFGEFVRYHFSKADYLPQALRGLPAAAICAGSIALLCAAWKRHALALGAAVVLLALVPVAIRGAYLINDRAWLDAPRLFSANAYALLFFLCVTLRSRATRPFAQAAFFVFIYFFAVVGMQETNAATLKNAYEVGFVNRVASRIESVVGDLYQRRHVLVVVGRFPPFPRDRFLRQSNGSNRAHIQSYAFESYRQTEILNFYLGADVLDRPTRAQEDRALASVVGREPWPAPGSVYTLDDMIVVGLERYSKDAAVTSTNDY